MTNEHEKTINKRNQIMVICKLPYRFSMVNDRLKSSEYRLNVTNIETDVCWMFCWGNIDQCIEAMKHACIAFRFVQESAV